MDLGLVLGRLPNHLGFLLLNATSTSLFEHLLRYLLQLHLHLDKEVRQGKWLREANRGLELNGKTCIGIHFFNPWISMGIEAANHAPIEKPFNLGVLQV